MTGPASMERSPGAGNLSRLPIYAWFTVFLVAALTAPLPAVVLIVLSIVPAVAARDASLLATFGAGYVWGLLFAGPVALVWTVASALLVRLTQRASISSLTALGAALPVTLSLLVSGGRVGSGVLVVSVLAAGSGALGAFAGLKVAILFHGGRG